ncbi:MAG: hypothetical protein AAGI25_13565 [Bacteroidota bacterium]
MKFSKPKNKKQALLYMLFIGAISFGILSCGGDDNNDLNLEGEEAESAWIYAYRTSTPQGRVYYMSAHEEIPSESNVSEAIELGLNSRIYSFGENPYTWNGNAATITKWDIDKTTLELSPRGILSFASTGISGNAGPPVFLSETQAFSAFLKEGVIVEWNPTDMEVTQTFEVAPIPELSVELTFYSEWEKYLLANGKILMPVHFRIPVVCCDWYDTPGAMVAVFDPQPEIWNILHIIV